MTGQWDSEVNLSPVCINWLVLPLTLDEHVCLGLYGVMNIYGRDGPVRSDALSSISL